MENELNSGRTLGGVFYLEGVPKSFEPEKKYPLKIIIGHPDQSRRGFQLSSRFAQSGTQAGRFLSLDDFTQVKESAGIQYLEHTEEGTREMNPAGRSILFNNLRGFTLSKSSKNGRIATGNVTAKNSLSLIPAN